jgi:hypothetical protein
MPVTGTTPFRYLPQVVQRLTPAEKLDQLRRLDPVKADAIVLLLDDALDREYGKQFHSDPTGGWRLKGGVQ